MFESIGKNKTKSFLIVLMVTVFFAIVMYYIAIFTGFGSYAIPMAVILASFSSILSYYHSDKLILSIIGARPADRKEDKKVREAMEGLCIAAGLPIPRIYIMDDPTANAFATGRNPDNAVVCVTTGLLEKLDYYELEGVLAHELAHIGNWDILLSTIVTVMIGIVIILSDIWRRSLFFGRGSRNKGGGGGKGHPLLMVAGFILIVVAPIAGMLMKMALSRNREYLADATAVQYTRNPDGLAGALAKLGGQSTPVHRATEATSNLFIVNPFADGEENEVGKGFSGLFSTHPPIAKRIQAIKNLR